MDCSRTAQWYLEKLKTPQFMTREEIDFVFTVVLPSIEKYGGWYSDPTMQDILIAMQLMEDGPGQD